MLQAELKKTKERLAELIEENKRQQTEIETFARVVNVLTVENHQLRSHPGHKRTPVTALRPAPEPGS
jgi:regulator of replication initiation timing